MSGRSLRWMKTASSEFASGRSLRTQYSALFSQEFPMGLQRTKVDENSEFASSE